MNIELKKESIKINEMAHQSTSEVLTEGDIIVPDTKPDIAKILQIDGKAVIKNREIQSDKVVLNGDAEISILYIPESDNGSSPQIKSINTTLGFTDVCEASGVKSDMNINANADVSHIEFNLINSRKLNLKSVVSVDLKVYKQNETELVSDVESDEPIETLKKPVKTYSLAADNEVELVIPDKLEVPASKPSIGEILKVDATVTGQDVKVITNKAIIKGAINICTLYLSNMEEDPVQFMEHEVPFTEILDLPGVAEGMPCDIDYNVQSLYYEVDNNMEDEARNMGVEVTMLVNVSAIKTENTEVLSDCYSPNYNITTHEKPCVIDYIEGMTSEQTTVKGAIELPEDFPAIMQVYNVVSKPYIEEAKIEDGKVVTKGVLDVYILYLTADPSSPIYSYKDEIEFTYTTDLGVSDENVAIEATACIVNCSYSLSGDKTVDIRANVKIGIKLIKSETVNVIDNITVAEAEKTKAHSIIICFVQEGDSLWNIAKRYKTTMSKIASANNIDENASPSAGSRLLIPKA